MPEPTVRDTELAREGESEIQSMLGELSQHHEFHIDQHTASSVRPVLLRLLATALAEGFAEGAKWMREECAKKCETYRLTPEQRQYVRDKHWDGESRDILPTDVEWGLDYALETLAPEAIRALPLEPRRE